MSIRRTDLEKEKFRKNLFSFSRNTLDNHSFLLYSLTSTHECTLRKRMKLMETSRERVTRADVAKAAGVSETIVSYVVNNNRYVAKEKRQRVEEAIRALNYRPNNMARALKGKKSNQILFIADHITNEYFSSIVSAMDQYAYEAGYLISLCANRNTPEFVSQVISRQYDGIIVSSASFPE